MTMIDPSPLAVLLVDAEARRTLTGGQYALWVRRVLEVVLPLREQVRRECREAWARVPPAERECLDAVQEGDPIHEPSRYHDCAAWRAAIQAHAERARLSWAAFETVRAAAADEARAAVLRGWEMEAAAKRSILDEVKEGGGE